MTVRSGDDAPRDRVQEFWERHPMSYDWDGRRGVADALDGGQASVVAEAMREDLAELHDSRGRLFGAIVDHDVLPGQDLLEVGCGLGAASAAFAASGASVTAVDLTRRGVTATRRLLDAQELPGRVVRASALDLPFADESFDRVWSWGVLHHTPDPARGCAEVVRVLRPGGRATVMVYSRASLYYWLHLILARGLLQGQLWKHSPRELEARFTDGAAVGGSPHARHFHGSELAGLFPGCRVTLSRRGQMSEVFPRVHRQLRRHASLRRLADRITRAWGWFLIADVCKAPPRRHSGRRLGVVSEIPAPYKTDEFHEMADRLSARGDELEVLYCASDHPTRGWRSARPDSRVASRVLDGVAVRAPHPTSLRVSYLNPGIVLPILCGRYDRVVFEGWNDLTVQLGALAARLRGVPYLVRCESHDHGRERSRLRDALRGVLARPLLAGAHGGIASGQRSTALLHALGLGRRDIRVAPLLATGAFLQARSPSPARVPTAPLRLVCVARDHPHKGLETLRQALTDLGRRRPELVVRCTWIGGPLEPLCSIGDEGGGTLVATGQSLGGRVQLLNVPRATAPEVAASLADAHALVLPSIEEPWGIAVAESLAVGRPVVVSDRVGAVPDLVPQDEARRTGWVFPAGDASALADVLLGIADDPAEAERRGAAGAELYDRHLRSRRQVLAGLLDDPEPTVSGAAPASRPRRVAYVNPFAAEVSGPDESLLVLLAGLDRARFAPVVFAPGETRYSRAYRELGCEVHLHAVDPLRRFRTAMRGLRYVLGFSRRLRRWRRAFREHEIDLVHCNMEVVPEAALAARSLGLQTITHVRGNAQARPLLFFDLFLRLVHAASSEVVCISQAVANLFHARGLSRRVRVIHNAVDSVEFGDPLAARRAQHLRAEVGCEAEDSLVGIVGRLHPRKGLDVFVEAAARVRASDPRVRFVVIGDTDSESGRRFRARLLDLARAVGVEDRLVFRGPQSDVASVMAALDVLVLPSAHEGFGRVLIEAMAAGRPVVASREGGPLEIVVDNETGYLVDARDPRAFADRILELLSDTDRARTMGAAGRERARCLFDRAVHAERFMSLYDELLGELALGRKKVSH